MHNGSAIGADPGAGLNRRRSVLLSAEAYERVRRAILSGELEPGQVVTEASLVRELEMSRTPVREALRRLQAERLLDAVPGIGWIVTEITAKSLIDLYRVREVLEGLAVELAAERMRQADVGRLRDIYGEMSAAIETDDNDELLRLNGEFHAAITGMGGNEHLSFLLSEIRGSFERYRLSALKWPGRRIQAHREHGELISALAEGNAALARRLAEEHVRVALDVRRGILGPEHSK